MKKFIIAALTASVLATPVLAAPGYDRHDDRGRFEQRHDSRFDNRFDNRGHQREQYRSWHRGERFDRSRARNYRVISARQYRLREAPRGYRYVQSGNDAVLIGITSGIVAAVFANAIR